MRRNRVKRHNNKHTKLIVAACIFIVCILFTTIGIIYTQRPKANSEANIKPKIQSAAFITVEDQKQQINNSNDQNKNNSQNTKKPDNTGKTNDNSTNVENTTPEPTKTKVAYLTFDDGPSTTVTPEVLDVLKRENVQATFFVVGSMCEQNPDLLRREKAEGHSIGNHSYSHDYKIIYSSPDNFLKDFKKSEDIITSIIGPHDTSLIRFPGGSFNRQSFRQVAVNAGYRYFDWNCLTGDAEVSRAPVDKLISNFNKNFANQDNLIILMHDAPYKTTTPQALPQIIQILKSKGYTFKTL